MRLARVTRVLLAVAFFGMSLGLSGGWSTPVFSHSDGASLEQTVGEYLIDVGYEPEELRAGEQVVLDFTLARNETPARYEKIWIKLSKDGQTYLATSIHRASLGKTTLSVLLPESGEYQLSTRFEDENSTLAEYEFPLQVSASDQGALAQNVVGSDLSQSTSSGLLGVTFLSGVVFGVGGALVTLRKLGRKP